MTRRPELLPTPPNRQVHRCPPAVRGQVPAWFRHEQLELAANEPDQAARRTPAPDCHEVGVAAADSAPPRTHRFLIRGVALQRESLGVRRNEERHKPGRRPALHHDPPLIARESVAYRGVAADGDRSNLARETHPHPGRAPAHCGGVGSLGVERWSGRTPQQGRQYEGWRRVDQAAAPKARRVRRWDRIAPTKVGLEWYGRPYRAAIS
jgi:hypothetical protein